MFRLSMVVVIGIALMFTYAEEELYSDKYDNIDVMSILNNDQLRDEYYNCAMDIGPCAEIATFFKDILDEVIKTQCKRCTEKQKIIFGQVIDWYIKNRPVEWRKLIKKYLDKAKIINNSNH